jgi:hypothetical protein
MTQAQIIPLCRLEWTGKAKLDSFVDIMLVKKCIYAKRELYNFFLKPSRNNIVRYNTDKLELLAYLLHRLCRKGIIRPKVNKGYFICAESHFTDFDKNKIKKNTLKYLSCEVHLKKSRYATIRAEVEEIIAHILKK